MSKKLKISFVISRPQGPEIVHLSGQTARTLQALILAGDSGVTALEISSWALRLSEYIRRLRHEYFLEILMVKEEHSSLVGAGWHGRYILKTPVRIYQNSEVA